MKHTKPCSKCGRYTSLKLDVCSECAGGQQISPDHTFEEFNAELNQISPNITHLVDDTLDLDIYQCDDCGAYADTSEGIRHFATCQVGSSKYWQGVYEQANAEEERYLAEER